jgi:hypothetical protein
VGIDTVVSAPGVAVGSVVRAAQPSSVDTSKSIVVCFIRVALMLVFLVENRY